MRMGAWSMARVLRQLIEYYYYSLKNHMIAILYMWYIYNFFLLYPNIYYSFYLLNMLVLCYLCVLQCCDVDGVYVKVSPISKIVMMVCMCGI